MAPAESWRRHAAEMVRHDLKDAREAWLQSIQDAHQQAEAEQSDYLAYRDAEGRYADFHALRHSFITMVGKAGVSPREAMELARHSDMRLTMKTYTDTAQLPLAATVRRLPSIGDSHIDSQTLVADSPAMSLNGLGLEPIKVGCSIAKIDSNHLATQAVTFRSQPAHKPVPPDATM